MEGVGEWDAGCSYRLELDKQSHVFSIGRLDIVALQVLAHSSATYREATRRRLDGRSVVQPNDHGPASKAGALRCYLLDDRERSQGVEQSILILVCR